MLGAVDGEFFSHFFFPKTVRQDSPLFAQRMWRMLDDPTARLLNFQMFRGSAKTTRARIYTARRIAYGLAHTILYIGKSEGHAIRSIAWLKGAVERNRMFSETFNLRPGSKWSEVEAEIIHGTDEYPVWIMGMGITGSIRGINRDDFRPDLIIVDDVLDDENSATPEQRDKLENLILGAVKASLAPASETPDAKMVILQTPLNKEDASTKALLDPEFKSLTVGVWTSETADLPLALQESIWPSRYPSEVMRKEKSAYIARNKLSVWTREFECRVISRETADFRAEWLKFYVEAPRCSFTIMAIDPVPPPSEIQIAKGLKDKDFECLAVIGYAAPNFYLLEYSMHRGHDPSWTSAEFLRLAIKYWPRVVTVESVAYQRTLAWILRQVMARAARYFPIREVTDKRKKRDKIIDSLNGVASEGKLFVHPSHAEFIQQFNEYPDVSHDDVLDAVATAIKEALTWGSNDDETDHYGNPASERDIPPLDEYRGAP